MPTPADTFAELGDLLDTRPDAREEYEIRVASRNRILDIGGRNGSSRSAKRLRELSRNPNSAIVSTDVIDEYEPDLVDDIANTQIPAGSFDGVYCDAILEHVTEYWKAIDNIRAILSDGGEAFIYVPFLYPFHDRMDYHRFTVTETARMLRGFGDVRVFAPEPHSGYGWVLTHMLTFGQIEKRPKAHARLASVVNAGVGAVAKRRYGGDGVTAEQASYWGRYLLVNHGFCAWVRK